jgi:hypothetical protein
MEINLGHIMQGWKNLAFPAEEAKIFLQELEDRRLAICMDCEFGEKDITLLSTCNDCGCFLKAKARCTDCACPQLKWLAVANYEQSIELESLIKE